MLSHTSCDENEEEAGVAQELVHDEKVRVGGAQ